MRIIRKTRALDPKSRSVYQTQSSQVSVFMNKMLFMRFRLAPTDEWTRRARMIPWAELERHYTAAFSTVVGSSGKPERMALDALIIGERYRLSDEDAVQEIRMNPLLQLFITVARFQHGMPFDQSIMSLLRKRIPAEIIMDLNDTIICPIHLAEGNV